MSVNNQSYLKFIPGLMSDVGPKIPANDAMPGWVVLFVKLFLYVSSDILLNIVFLKCLNECQYNQIASF